MDGETGSVNFTEPGYDEAQRGQAGQNHSFTDYAQSLKMNQNQGTRRVSFTIGSEEGKGG